MGWCRAQSGDGGCQEDPGHPSAAGSKDMRRVKLIAVVVVSILTIVILVQNTEPVQARILLWAVPMSLFLLMMLTFFLGFVVGILVPTYFLRKPSGKPKPGPDPSR